MTDTAVPVVEIDGCCTVSKLFWQRVTSCSDEVALREKDFGIWNEYTWHDFGDRARLAGLGLKALGLERGERTVDGDVSRVGVGVAADQVVGGGMVGQRAGGGGDGGGDEGAIECEIISVA